MEAKYTIMLVLVVTIVGQSSSAGVWTLIHDVVQNNIAGVPVIHEKTQWNFDPEQGKERRGRFVALNGEYGEDLIARLGMGMSFSGPWGTKVSNKPKSALQHA